MCLGAPGQVIAITGEDGTVGQSAWVDFWGVRRTVQLDLVDEPVAIGDFVLVHVGFAIRRIPADEVEATLAYFAALAEDEAAASVEGRP